MTKTKRLKAIRVFAFVGISTSLLVDALCAWISYQRHDLPGILQNATIIMLVLVGYCMLRASSRVSDFKARALGLLIAEWIGSHASVMETEHDVAALNRIADGARAIAKFAVKRDA